MSLAWPLVLLSAPDLLEWKSGDDEVLAHEVPVMLTDPTNNFG